MSDMQDRAGVPHIPYYLAPLATLNPLYGKPDMQQAARDQANGGHDIADDYPKKKSKGPTDAQIEELGALGSIAASEDEEDYTEDFSLSRANALKVGARMAPLPKEFSLRVSEAEYQKLVANQSDTPAQTKTDSKSAPATGGKMQTVDSTNWLDRADQIAWEGVKNVTGAKDNPKKQVYFNEGVTRFVGKYDPGHGPGEVTGNWAGTLYDKNNQPIGTQTEETRITRASEEAAQKSRDSAMKVGAKICPTPKEFFDPINALIAGAVAVPVGYAVGKAADYVYDAATQSDADWEAKHGKGATKKD